MFVEEQGNRVLLAESEGSASGLWRVIQPHPAPGTVSWRWKIEPSTIPDRRERTRKGDDYPARVFVLFEPRLLSWKNRALCYVWAVHEPARSTYDSPYTETVKTVVLQSGNGGAGRWVTEERDVAADYRRAFGGDPGTISAVGLMVDTDNTGTTARSWFDDLVLRPGGER